jgi:thiosulfate/3-mercaptopyruvate sulfurtransferase
MKGSTMDSPLVTTDWLASHLDDPGVRVIDCRWYLRPFDRRCGDDEYRAGHIPGSVHLRWDTDLADPDRPHSMLAPPERFAAVVSRCGIGDDSFVVTYDDHHVPVAARVWWSFRVYGHGRVAVVDGGISRWRAEGRALVTGNEAPPAPATFSPVFCPQLYATKEQVRSTLGHASAPRLIDARMDGAWDAAGGHIPGAVRLPGLGFLGDAQTSVNADEAHRRIAAVGVAGDRAIAYCGGGVAATGTALGFRLAGLPDVAVYDGSWAEWEADPTTPKEQH